MAQVEDLELQIRDLKFYNRARKTLDESPMKDELQQGTLVTHIDPKQQVGSDAKLNKKKKTKRVH